MFGLRDLKIVVKDLSLLLILISLVMLLPVLVGLFYADSYDTFDDFLLAAALTGGIGAVGYFSIRHTQEMSLKHAIALMVLFWPIAALFSAIPILTTGAAPSFIDAYFEGMSGWTTGGLSTISGNVESFPHSVNMWRGLLQFMGGIGVLLISIVVLVQARTGSESISLVAPEFDAGERIRPGIWTTTKTLITLFLFFLIICTILFLIAGMNPFDALFHAMTGLATGGFSTHPNSIAYFRSSAIELAAVIVMIIGATNVAIHFAVLSGNYKELLFFRNIEVKSFVVFLIIFSSAGAFWLLTQSSMNSMDAINESFFHVVSGLTTTGWTVASSGSMSASYPSVFLLMIVVCALIGGHSVSTAAGIRQVRVALIIKSLWWHIKKTLLPSTVVFPRSYHHIVKKTVTDSRMTDIYIFISILFLMLLISTIVVMSHGYSLERSFLESTTSLTTLGMGFGIASPTAATGVKVMLIINMWLGRIEIVPLLLFIASFSRKFK
ncbi:MAG: TrkH family potassium uptake protein [Thermoplasmata archaeon]